jgi:hypothetical protein
MQRRWPVHAYRRPRASRLVAAAKGDRPVNRNFVHENASENAWQTSWLCMPDRISIVSARNNRHQPRHLLGLRQTRLVRPITALSVVTTMMATKSRVPTIAAHSNSLSQPDSEGCRLVSTLGPDIRKSDVMHPSNGKSAARRQCAPSLWSLRSRHLPSVVKEDLRYTASDILTAQSIISCRWEPKLPSDFPAPEFRSSYSAATIFRYSFMAPRGANAQKCEAMVPSSPGRAWDRDGDG